MLFGIETASRHWHEALLRLIPITAFVVGVVAAEMVGRSRVRGRLHRPLRVVLAAEIVILAAVASLPDNAPALVVTVPVSFAAAIQWTIFPSTLLASGNLRGVGVSAYLWIADRDPTARRQTLRFGAVVGAFVVGAMIGGVCTNNFGTSAAAVAAGILLIILGVVIRETAPAGTPRGGPNRRGGRRRTSMRRWQRNHRRQPVCRYGPRNRWPSAGRDGGVGGCRDGGI